jgi:ABC-type transporter Mla subunit MlaD
MKNSAKYRILLNWIVIVVFSTALWLSQAKVAVVQTNNVTIQKEAVSRLAQFKNEVSNMRSVVNKPLGPYPIYTRCTWCSEKAWWGFGLCTKETTETWDTKVDFTWTRQALSRILDQAQQNASTFSSRYEPTQQWITDLPVFSKNFDIIADIVLRVQQEIKGGIGPNDQQSQIVKQALQALAKDLDRSSSLLQGGTSALAAFLQQQSSYREAIRQGIGSADSSAQAALTNLEKQSKTHHCQDGLKEKYDGIRADFSRSLQEISSAFQKLEGSSRDAEKSLSQLLGSVVNSQTELKTVLNLVNAAGNDKLGSFLEQLHLNAAKKQWRDLADYAVGNLSN